MTELSDLARAARPINDEDWGSERQVAAENELYANAKNVISTQAWERFEDWGLKATTEERIAEALRLAAFDNETQPRNPAKKGNPAMTTAAAKAKAAKAAKAAVVAQPQSFESKVALLLDNAKVSGGHQARESLLAAIRLVAKEYASEMELAGNGALATLEAINGAIRADL